ncbi:HLA class II histocompatibility antigen, DQ beta 1 chain-like isoform X3 [Phaenicophaeus curvirostris]|uniref:HLA class II histocompatibility antigen, DQ beta 1 chain-like isoform X3 n=1 Tax=Phaenicophaeus curvirostris TaxID=33595 RepID=UPI0037F0CB63
MLPSCAAHWAALGLPVAPLGSTGAECGWLGGAGTSAFCAGSTMGAAGVLGAGAVLVALVALGAHGAAGEESRGFFEHQQKSDCYFTNGTERVRLVQRYIYNREQLVHFDSDVGVFVADTPLGEPVAKQFNSQEDFLQYLRAAVDTFCRHNYEAWTPFTVDRRAQSPAQTSPGPAAGGSSHPIACSWREETDPLDEDGAGWWPQGFGLDGSTTFFPRRALRPWNGCAGRWWSPHPWRGSQAGQMKCSEIWVSSGRVQLALRVSKVLPNLAIQYFLVSRT